MPDGSRRSCDFEYPASDHEPARTRDQRSEALKGLFLAANQLARAVALVDPDDEDELGVLEASLGQMQDTAILLKDDAVSARVERENAGRS